MPKGDTMQDIPEKFPQRGLQGYFLKNNNFS
jgi:hypothetical protein